MKSVKSLKKIRRLFLVVAAVLLVSLGLLIRKAFTSAASERASRHRAVAERALDEMERELTTFLRREESRPFEHYRHTYVPEAPRAEAVRSPLADIPEAAFVIGYFQVGPDGSFSSPHRGETESSAQLDDWVAALEEVVRLVWRVREAAPTTRQKAGSTVEVTPKPTKKQLLLGTRYLESLNRGARSRDRRVSKLEQTLASNTGPREPAVTDWDNFAQEDADEVLDVRLEPMVGRSAGAGLLLLYRTVSVDTREGPGGARAYRQGLLLDETALVDWLGRRVLSDDELASRADFSVDPSPATASASFRGYTYRHRFAEPFGSVHGVLRLGELPEISDSTDLVLLCVLLVLTSTLGLWGLYRMVAVVVEFAERRHNFVSAVTHELKTPLTAIRMYGEMLRDGVVPEEGKRQKYYETITAETERLTRLLQNVLELARLEKDTRTMNMTVGDAGEVLTEVVALLSPHAGERGFALITDVEPGLPQVRYDRDALVQVLFNLVDNALKYARDSQPKEVVLACRREGEGVALSVADHGPGVAREHLKKVFEPFYRGENELTRTAKGTGIGLSLVRGLVEQMGGRVTGRNLRSRGFEVVVSLSP